MRVSIVRIGATLLLVLGGLLLSILVVRVSLVTQFPPPYPLGAEVAPDDPSIVMGDALIEFVTQRARISSPTYQRVLQAFRAMPLAAEPFLFEATMLPERGGNDRAIRLLEEARRRDPRFTFTRLLLVDRYFRAARIEDAAREIIVLERLLPERGADLLIQGLAMMAADRTMTDRVARAVAHDRARDLLLDYLVNHNAPFPTIMQIAARGPQVASETSAAWQGALISRLIGQGDVHGAMVLWSRYNATTAPVAGAIFDPGFRGLAGAPPFNWEYASGHLGTANRRGGGGVDVDYFGRESGSLLRQLLLFPPGQYRFAFSAEGDANPQNSGLYWHLVCRSGAPSLIELPVRSAQGARVNSAMVTVPPHGCDEQWLSLDGVAGEFPTEQNVSITQVRLQHVGATP